TGANTGALANIMAEGPTDECMQAAVEALSGVNNIGDYKNFIALSWANFDSYSEYTIIENHCFYKR
ncbi:MAG: cell wall hydrolase, partial [Lachnospiraceae bacterium]|nr:cell wall hydrolase [Lachnospiraceae bacterium]